MPIMEDTVNGVKEQRFNYDKKTGDIILHNKLSLDDTFKDNQASIKNNDDPKGFTKDRSMRRVASIDSILFFQEPLLIEYSKALNGGNEALARRCMNLFLQLNPRFKVSEGRV